MAASVGMSNCIGGGGIDGDGRDVGRDEGGEACTECKLTNPEQRRKIFRDSPSIHAVQLGES